MSDKFVCKIAYGVRDGRGRIVEQLEPGKRYDAWAYSDEQVRKWIDLKIIEMVE